MENSPEMGAHSYSKGSATGGSEEAAKYKKNKYKLLFWCPHTDSNREPTDYKSVALPIEL